MTTGIASKNLFELLGNDPDSDGEIRPPTKQVIKQVQTTKKKDVAPETAPPASANRGGRQGRGNRYSGNEAAFRDRTAGSDVNRTKRTDEPQAGSDGQRTEGRGQRGRGYGGRGRQYDRRSGGHGDTDKKVSQGWGSDEKEHEEEVAGAAIAQTEANEDPAAATAGETEPAGEEAAPQEPEEVQKTYDDFLAEQKAKKEALGALPQARQPNEGTRGDDKWKNATAVKKEDEEEEVFIAGKEAKARKERERKQKQVVDVDMRFQEAPRRGGGERGGRGGRGGRGDGERRGRGGQQGGFRGEHRGGERRGGNRSNGPSVNLADTSAFPSLGGN